MQKPEPDVRAIVLTSLLIVSLLCTFAISAAADAEPSTPPNTLMCSPGELIFSEDFDPETVSDRWWFKADFALRDGALLRTTVDPTESKRVFLKDPSFHNTIIQFDFKLSGKTTDLRLVTGSGGGYNSVTQIRLDHFQINTPVDRDAEIVPAHLGECRRKSRPDQWQTMTVEYWDDEIVAHLGDNEFVIGRHPIIDRTRKYFAFQFDLPGASIDNIHVWQANGQRENWAETHKKLAAAQADRVPVKRDPEERYKYEYTNLKSRLTLTDQTYRDLVATHDELQATLHADYAEAFITHKQLGKLIAKRKQHIKESDPDFKRMEIEVHRAARAEDAYVLSTKPELASLKEVGFPSSGSSPNSARSAPNSKPLATNNSPPSSPILPIDRPRSKPASPKPSKALRPPSKSAKSSANPSTMIPSSRPATVLPSTPSRPSRSTSYKPLPTLCKSKPLPKPTSTPSSHPTQGEPRDDPKNH